jgi:hypothetical protein
MNLDWLPRDTDPIAKAARVYAAHGWRIFPCIGKVPAIPKNEGGKGLHDATTDEAQIREWWTRWPTANVGWPLAEGWTALDVDIRHGGVESLRQLAKEHGPLPPTLRQTTGTGGEHWIYRANGRQLAGARPGLDTRVGGRGYLLIAPSVHPDTLKAYRWHTTIDPTEPPPWLAALWAPPPPEPERKPYRPPPRESAAWSKRERYARVVLRKLAEEVAGAGQGGRNDTLNKAWFRAAQFRDVLPQGEVRDCLLEAARSCGLTDREALQVLRVNHG